MQLSNTNINLATERDIVKFFSMSSIGVRPEASQVIFGKVQQINFSEHKKAYLDKMLKKLKEKQALLIHNQGAGNNSGQMILDYETAVMIVQQLSVKEVDTYLHEE